MDDVILKFEDFEHAFDPGEGHHTQDREREQVIRGFVNSLDDDRLGVLCGQYCDGTQADPRQDLSAKLVAMYRSGHRQEVAELIGQDAPISEEAGAGSRRVYQGVNAAGQEVTLDVENGIAVFRRKGRTNDDVGRFLPYEADRLLKTVRNAGLDNAEKKKAVSAVETMPTRMGMYV